VKNQSRKQPPAHKGAASKAKTAELSAVVQQVYHDLEGDFPVEDIQRVIQAEQAAVEKFLIKGYRVSKHGYMTLYTSASNPRRLLCPLDGKQYDIGETVRINVRIGE